jgi:hypothetical protein
MSCVRLQPPPLTGMGRRANERRDAFAPGLNGQRLFSSSVPQQRYVAFVDVLGFGAHILRDFEGAFSLYKQLLQEWHGIWRPGVGHEVAVTIYSDALLLTTSDLRELTLAVNGLSFVSLMNNTLVRGGIGFGKHVEVHEGGDVYVVSEALTRAVEVEKHVRFPCVGLHESVDVPSDWWSLPNIARPIIHFEGTTLVNPFGAFWYRSAAGRVQLLKEKYPDQHAKHDWFLRLYDSFEKNAPLIPPQTIEGTA